MSAFPSTSRFFLGNYDRFAERGALLSVTAQRGDAVRSGCGRFALTEGDGRVGLTLGVGTLGADRTCTAGEDDVCAGDECIEASRLSGDDLSTCNAAVQGLVVQWEIRQCARDRFLDVRTFDASTGELLRPGAGTQLNVGVLSGNVPLRAADVVPEALTARFPIEEPTATSSAKYLVYSIRRTAHGADAAMPPCVVDRLGR